MQNCSLVTSGLLFSIDPCEVIVGITGFCHRPANWEVWRSVSTLAMLLCSHKIMPSPSLLEKNSKRSRIPKFTVTILDENASTNGYPDLECPWGWFCLFSVQFQIQKCLKHFETYLRCLSIFKRSESWNAKLSAEVVQGKLNAILTMFFKMDMVVWCSIWAMSSCLYSQQETIHGTFRIRIRDL